MTAQEFGIFLRDLRRNAKLRQIDVSRKFGYSSAQFVSNWERGLIQPPFSTLKALAVLFQVNADEIGKAYLSVIWNEYQNTIPFDLTNS